MNHTVRTLVPTKDVTVLTTHFELICPSQLHTTTVIATFPLLNVMKGDVQGNLLWALRGTLQSFYMPQKAPEVGDGNAVAFPGFFKPLRVLRFDSASQNGLDVAFCGVRCTHTPQRTAVVPQWTPNLQHLILQRDNKPGNLEEWMGNVLQRLRGCRSMSLTCRLCHESAFGCAARDRRGCKLERPLHVVAHPG